MKVTRRDSVNRSETSEVQNEELQKKKPNLGIAKAKDSFENTASKVSSKENPAKTIQPKEVVVIVAASTFGAASGLVAGAVAVSGAIIGQAASSGNIGDEASPDQLKRQLANAFAVSGQAASSSDPTRESSNENTRTRRTIKKKD